MGICGIVLASGKSTRMGKQKLLLKWKGIPLIEHLLNQTIVVPFKKVKVVIPNHNENLKKIVDQYEYTAIPNANSHLGMGHSLALAVQSLSKSTEAAIIFLGDQPTMSSEDMRRVWATFKRIRSRFENCPKMIIQTKYSNGKVGHPVLFSHHFFAELRSLCGDHGGRDIIRKNSSYLFHCYSGNEYPNDIDTPYEYIQLIKEKGEY